MMTICVKIIAQYVVDMRTFDFGTSTNSYQLSPVRTIRSILGTWAHLFMDELNTREEAVLSGKLSHTYASNHHFEWENLLFLWPFSIAMFPIHPLTERKTPSPTRPTTPGRRRRQLGLLL